MAVATSVIFATVSHEDSQPGKGEYKNTFGALPIRELVTCGEVPIRERGVDSQPFEGEYKDTRRERLT